MGSGAVMRGLALLLLLLAPAQALAASEGIVLVIGDDISRGSIGVYRVGNVVDFFTGHAPDTPNLDTMAAAGVRFDHFRSNSSCTKSRAEIMAYGAMTEPTNTYGAAKQPTAAITDTIINPYANNLVRQLKALDFTTSFYCKEHLFHDADADPSVSGTFTAALGWDRAPVTLIGNPGNDPVIGNGPELPEDWTADKGHTLWHKVTLDGTKTFETEYVTKACVDAAVDQIDTDAATGEGKFFYMVSVPAAHSPWDGTDRPPGDVTSSGADEVYLSQIEDLDTRMASIRTAMAAFDTYTTIFMADNGIPVAIASLAGVPEECDRSLGAKNTPYPCGTYVPFIVEGTNIAAGEVMTQQYRISDLPATLIDLAGGTIASSPGKSFADCMTGTGGWTTANCWERACVVLPEFGPIGGATDGTLKRLPLTTDADTEWTNFEIAGNCEIGTAHGVLHRIYNPGTTTSGFMDEFCEIYAVIDDTDRYQRYTDTLANGGFRRANTCDEGVDGGAIDAADFLTAQTDDEALLVTEAHRQINAVFDRNGSRDTTF